MSEVYVGGKVLPTWELTQAAAQEAISNTLGYPVIVGDDGYVWLESDESVILGSLGWSEQKVGEQGHDGLSKWHFTLEVT